jgi:hypothetical protein
MMVMPANNASGIVHHLATQFPGSLGHLWSPGRPIKTYKWLPYVLDNGVYRDFANHKAWDGEQFLDLVKQCKYLPQSPLWVVVPDVVGNGSATIDLWADWEPKLRKFGYPLAFVVQDGITISQIPTTADVIFVGGSDKWKYPMLEKFIALGKPVHVGRVNNAQYLWRCYQLGVTSCDGSGWFRSNHGNNTATDVLVNFVRSTHGQQEIAAKQLSLIEEAEIMVKAIGYDLDLAESGLEMQDAVMDWLAMGDHDLSLNI